MSPLDLPASSPVGWPGLYTLSALGVLFLLVLAKARLSAGGGEKGARRSWLSLAGILLQAAGIALAGRGRVSAILPSGSPAGIGEAVAVALLMGIGLWLFAAATRTMGRNWSLVARTRADHSLVTTGIFGRIRHPIYTALFLLLAALAVAFGHYRQLLLAVPVYALGTAIRVREEERLLEARFGSAYSDYASRVTRFIPRLF